jgi:translation initiation factor 4A
MGVKCHVCIGGRSVKRDVRELAKGVHIVVGTSGRVHGMIRDGALKPEKVKILCVDEADQMLSGRDKTEITKGRSFPTPLPVSC